MRNGNEPAVQEQEGRTFQRENSVCKSPKAGGAGVVEEVPGGQCMSQAVQSPREEAAKGAGQT